MDKASSISGSDAALRSTRTLGINVRHSALLIAGMAFWGDVSAGGPRWENFVSLAGFHPLKATLHDVKGIFGEAEEFRVPGGHYEWAICYRAKNSPAILLFHTDEELGMRTVLMGISVESVHRHRYPCATTDLSGVSLSLGGLELGASEVRFRQLVGPGLERIDSVTLRRGFDHSRKLTAKERKDMETTTDQAYIGQSVWGVFADGKLVEYGVWMDETY